MEQRGKAVKVKWGDVMEIEGKCGKVVIGPKAK